MAVELLFPESGSAVDEAADAELLNVPAGVAAAMSATSVNAADCPFPSVAIVQATVPPLPEAGTVHENVGPLS